MPIHVRLKYPGFEKGSDFFQEVTFPMIESAPATRSPDSPPPPMQSIVFLAHGMNNIRNIGVFQKCRYNTIPFRYQDVKNKKISPKLSGL
jgi:hypothetical protein